MASTEPTLAEREAQLELGITLSLFLWPSLTLAVTNLWGGPDSSSKREFFAQTTIDLLRETPDADEAWIEEFLLQFMIDEFEINVDDESGWEVAEQICRLRKDCAKGDFGGVRVLKERWDRRGGRDVVQGFENGGEVVEEGSEGDEEDADGDVDMDMDEAPQLVGVKERVAPVVDEEGFTTVSKRKKR